MHFQDSALILWRTYNGKEVKLENKDQFHSKIAINSIYKLLKIVIRLVDMIINIERTNIISKNLHSIKGY